MTKAAKEAAEATEKKTRRPRGSANDDGRFPLHVSLSPRSNKILGAVAFILHSGNKADAVEAALEFYFTQSEECEGFQGVVGDDED